MRLQVFQSGKGDCLLLTSSSGSGRILIDGGMPDAYKAHIGPAMGKLRDAKKKIDLVYVSHIDQDHIGGILKLLDDEVAWRVHQHQKSNGNPGHKAPTVPRPPEIHGIWHNAFHEQLKKNAGDIEDQLAASAPLLQGADVAGLREAGHEQSNLATSIREAIAVSRRIGKDQLGIPLNKQSNGKLMMRRKGQGPISIGDLRVTILGPTEADLRRLRTDWDAWLRVNKQALKTIRETAIKDEGRLGTSELKRFMLALALQAEAFGDPSKVTPPNLASLTLLVEQGGQSILLTGDAVGKQVTNGLVATGRLVSGQTIQVDMLKVPHHGSENNVDRDFCDTVIAKDYVFCGNGEHQNPDLRIVDLFVRRRLAVPGKFKLWFNSSSAVVTKDPPRKHMKKIEDLVRRLALGSQGRMTSKFLEHGSSFSIA